MKAKEYLRKYIEEDQDKSEAFRCVSILFEMFDESRHIISIRKAKSDRAVIAIMDEQNDKANAFIRKINELGGTQFQKDIFKRLIKEEMPELHKQLGWS